MLVKICENGVELYRKQFSSCDMGDAFAHILENIIKPRYSVIVEKNKCFFDNMIQETVYINKLKNMFNEKINSYDLIKCGIPTKFCRINESIFNKDDLYSVKSINETYSDKDIINLIKLVKYKIWEFTNNSIVCKFTLNGIKYKLVLEPLSYQQIINTKELHKLETYIIVDEDLDIDEVWSQEDDFTVSDLLNMGCPQTVIKNFILYILKIYESY